MRCAVNLLFDSAVWCHTEVAKDLNDKSFADILNQMDLLCIFSYFGPDRSISYAIRKAKRSKYSRYCVPFGRLSQRILILYFVDVKMKFYGYCSVS